MSSTESSTFDAATPTLHFLCGKIGAGKSTLAARLAARPRTLLLSEDRWLAALYPGEIVDVTDYGRCASRLRNAMGSHVAALAAAGLSVVLDFPANTRRSREWLRAVAVEAGCAHQLHYLDVPDPVCKARLRARNAAGEHPFQTSDAEYDAITAYFVEPDESEGLRIVKHAWQEDGQDAAAGGLL
ncbi:AAA family ATPase [Achromobacter arsenitoxydans]|uniref:Cell division protein ZipA n=1 Tax=Achromobacter arsenitoxydans SY8 TaxID=477184 RepID=H0F100_9BURK|nr:ATP-binding protein [Achromobacter arsenitoxydans]EHK68038.1 cell division protein ZipA [Achromobacter arsenitoxydans SY8]